MPGFFAPMGASVADGIPRGDNWMFEVKWDGVRGLIFIDNGAMTIYTRNNNRCEGQYPELQVLPHYVDARQAILDGEIVATDTRGISKFELIQPRIHTRDAAAIAKMASKNPVNLYLFDYSTWMATICARRRSQNEKGCSRVLSRLRHWCGCRVISPARARICWRPLGRTGWKD